MNRMIQRRTDKILTEISFNIKTAEQLGNSVGVCVRTIYRDIERLRSVGYDIMSCPGRGFLLEDRGN